MEKSQFTHEDIVENLAEGLIAVDPGLVVRAFNQSAEKICEVSRSTVLGKPAGEVFRRNTRVVEMLS